MGQKQSLHFSFLYLWSSGQKYTGHVFPPKCLSSCNLPKSPVSRTADIWARLHVLISKSDLDSLNFTCISTQCFVWLCTNLSECHCCGLIQHAAGQHAAIHSFPQHRKCGSRNSTHQLLSRFCLASWYPRQDLIWKERKINCCTYFFFFLTPTYASPPSLLFPIPSPPNLKFLVFIWIWQLLTHLFPPLILP